MTYDETYYRSVRTSIKDQFVKAVGEPSGLDDLARKTIEFISKKAPVAGFSWDIRHSEEVSNSHSHPIAGVSNWSRDKKKPSGYPGWYGRVYIRYADPKKSYGSDPFSGAFSYPGTGGTGHYNGPWKRASNQHYRLFTEGRYDKDIKHLFPEPNIYSWDYRFYDSDWPDLYKDDIFNLLKYGTKTTYHEFYWQDPAFTELDEKLEKLFYARYGMMARTG